MKLLYVYEYADDVSTLTSGDFLWRKTRDSLDHIAKNNNSDIQIYSACGILRKHVDGGTSWRRLVNFFWMHFVAFFKLLILRPDYIFVRTTPPLIQLPYIFWGKIFGAKIYLWLMDYHPVFGVRTTKKYSLKNFIWRFFDKIDRALLSWVSKVVCLDNAMSDLIEQRTNGKIATFICPTFSPQKGIFFDLAKRQDKVNELSLLYSGNLGRAHNTDLLEKLLRKLSEFVKVKLAFCGKSKDAIVRLSELAQRNNIEFNAYPFVENYSDLGTFYKDNGFDYGIVLLNHELQGVVSPSKFSGYSSFGLPIIYIGPQGTNADILCKKFFAGVSVSSDSSINECVEYILQPTTQAILARNTMLSIDYFSSQAGECLAEFLYKEMYNN